MAPGSDRPSRGQSAQLATLGLGLGYFADRWLGTQPWLLLSGLGLGIAAAGVNFYRTIKALNRMDQSDGNS
jgi:ATP synthase protein I